MTLEEQGKFALEHGFRWMPGCVSIEDPEARVLWIEPNGKIVVHIRYATYRPSCMEAGSLPDFSDAATIGCLEEQVREKWGRSFHLQITGIPQMQHEFNQLTWVPYVATKTGVPVWEALLQEPCSTRVEALLYSLAGEEPSNVAEREDDV